MNEKFKVKNLKHAEYTQVTGAGQVIEIIRAEILYHHEESVKDGLSNEMIRRHCIKRHGLEGLLNAICLSELKMQAWQELKGKKPITGELYKQLANQDLFEHDGDDDDEGSQHETSHQKEDRLAMEDAERIELEFDRVDRKLS